VAALAVVAIGLYFVGRATEQLAVEAPPATIDLDDAVLWIGDQLPDGVTARLSYGDVALLSSYVVDHLELVGVALPTRLAAAPERRPGYRPAPVEVAEAEGSAGESGYAGVLGGVEGGDVVDVMEAQLPAVFDEGDCMAYVIGRASEDGLAVDDVEAVQVVHAFLRYLAAVGAIGSEVR
jgi:hypothetical protein